MITLPNLFATFRSLVCALVFVCGLATTLPAAEKHYLYVCCPGIRNQLEYGGHGVLVFDIDQQYRFVKRIPIPGLGDDGKPLNIKGVCASAHTGLMHITTIRSVIAVDLVSENVLWEKQYDGGCDRLAVSPDGETLYVPSFEKDHWHVLASRDGKVLARLEPKSGAHNTIYGPNGKDVYLAGLKSNLLSIAHTAGHQLARTVGPFTGSVRPFTVNSRQTRVYACINDLLGFEIGDLTTGQRLARVEVANFEKGAVKRHGCPSHGIGLTPDESEIWVTDGYNQSLHIFDATQFPPVQKQSVHLRDEPGWITFSLDGQHAWPSTGEVIATAAKTIVTTLKDETGASVASEKMVEVHLTIGADRAQKVLRTGDQFGIGRR